jgi:GDSL-like Lipase/Acylhydrolase family
MIRPLIFSSALAVVAFSLPAVGQTSPPPLEYTPLATPCRAVDTRTTTTPIQGGSTRTFSPFAGGCNIPVPSDGIIVYAANVTVVPHEGLGYLTVWPSGEAQPTVSLLNSYDARTKANAALVSGGTDGNISVFASNTTDFILDVSGYFTATTTGMVYVPVTPCRIIDTRNGTGGGGTASRGAPDQPDPLVAGQTRTWEIAYPVTVDDPVPGANNCNLPYDVGAAYSVNVTVVPIDNGPVWTASVYGASAPVLPAATQPPFSNLNATTGTDTANAAIINGPLTFTAYADTATDLVVDVTGWFAPANVAPEGLSLYALPPCRALDTRQTSMDGQLPGTLQISLAGPANLNCALPAGLPTPQSFVLNATVVPTGPLGYLTLWPDGMAEPVVSTLNANDGAVTSNMAIVGTGPLSSNPSFQAIQANTVTPTALILDESGVFALNPTARQPTVVFIGDESTSDWPMAGHPNWINRGVAGNTTDQMLARFQTDVIDLHPDVVHIMGGGNDVNDEDWPEFDECGIDTCENYNAMAEMANAAGIRVIFGTPAGIGSETENEEIDVELLCRQLRLNYGTGNLPGYLLDYARANADYAAMTQMAEAEIGLAAGSPITEMHLMHEISGVAK